MYDGLRSNALAFSGAAILQQDVICAKTRRQNAHDLVDAKRRPLQRLVGRSLVTLWRSNRQNWLLFLPRRHSGPRTQRGGRKATERASTLCARLDTPSARQE